MAKKILVIEDENDSRFVLICQLRFMGYEPLEAATGEQGIERATAERPNLILMDLAMPNLTGIEIATILKKTPRLRIYPSSPTRLGNTAPGKSQRCKQEWWSI
jgi:CheY-like chemotaxis protein